MNKRPHPLKVYVECGARTGRAMAHISPLLGCFSKGETIEEALVGIPQSVRWYLNWTRAHGEMPPDEWESVDFVIVEQVVGGAAGSSGSRVAIFTPDLEPVDDPTLDRCLQLMAYSRADIVALSHGLSSGQLRLRKQPGDRSVAEILRHLASAERYYLTRLWTLSPFEPQKDPLARLQLVRHAAYDYLRRASAPDRSRQVVVEGERWTLRKILRRFVEHEIEHLQELSQVLQREASA